MLKNIRTCHYLWLTRYSFRIRIFTVGAHVHVIVIVLLFQRWPSFLADKGCIIFVFRCVLFKEGLSGRTLRLSMMTNVSTNILALVKASVVDSFLHAFCSYDVGGTSLIRVVENVGICDVLCMYAATTFDKWQGLVSTNGV
jgi:hypothetical protein